MVYSIGSRDPYATTTGVDVIDGDYDSVTKMKFLHPEQVDAVAKIEGRVQMTQGYAVDPATSPKKLCWRSGNRKLPDFITYGTVMVVSEKVREIIEEFEPGVHQLLPVDVYRPKANVPFARYYWLVVCNRIDSVDRKNTTLKQGGRFGGSMWQPTERANDKLVFNLSLIGLAYLWRDPNLIGVMCSDELVHSLREAGVTGLETNNYEQV